jgi:hypothetical protein
MSPSALLWLFAFPVAGAETRCFPHADERYWRARYGVDSSWKPSWTTSCLLPKAQLKSIAARSWWPGTAQADRIGVDRPMSRR